jgi:hypothetical protein
MRFTVRALGWVLVALGALVATGVIGFASSGSAGGAVVCLVTTSIFAGGGVLLLRSGQRMKGTGPGLEPAGAVPGPSIEQRVLAAARRHRGHLTPVSAAADGDLTVDQAREELERLAKENACLMDVSDEGLVVFRFPEFESTETKRLS